ncbi:hypothetical protein [Bacillus glycinifermentans]|uniref:hypothetical protein n=1 Tax=Bacillus glycinifermentans TaxID=1664069 RepID=UPI000B316530|nr:hypothetical protein [Bacillus glycinifermentans]
MGKWSRVTFGSIFLYRLTARYHAWLLIALYATLDLPATESMKSESSTEPTGTMR